MRARTATVSMLLLVLLPGLLAARSPEDMARALVSGSADDLDSVCGVRDCADIRLFWYTDLEEAKKQARAEGKPILSLRLLGRLDEEFSCANSRYFRTVYYKNREINDLLRDRFVLHWRSVRPVPKVTIDFGDGNRLERTLTGNSIHYVLDSRGRLVEALPGLSGPATFLALLKDAERPAGEAARLGNRSFVRWAAARHGLQLNERAKALLQARRELQPEEAAWTPGVIVDRINVGGLETGSKMAGERSILAALDGVSDDELRDLAEARRPRIHLDADSRAFLLRKHGVTDPGEAERLVDAFEATVALDEVINEYRTGPAILRKLSDPEAREALELEAFNEWVYEEVFRAPLSDPWMGLAPEDVYVALPAPTRTAAPRP